VEVWQTSNLRRLTLGEEKKKETTGQNITSASATQGGQKKETEHEQKYNVRICYARRP